MEDNKKALNKFMVGTFHEVLKVQENLLKKSRFNDLSLNKIHILEEIAMYQPITMTNLATKINVTVGTLTVAIDNLVKKEYVKRERSEADRRIVNLQLTEKGKLASGEHKKFHEGLINSITNTLNENDIKIFCNALDIVTEYLEKVSKKGVKMRIITDSTCDLDFDFLKDNGVDIVKLNYFFGEDAYIDGESMTNKEFYEKLAQSDALPTTSQPSPDQFYEVFKKALADGEEVLGIFISSELSGTFQSATIAKSMLETDKIHLVDSRAATFSLGSVVLEALRLKTELNSVLDVKTKLEEFIEKNELIAVVGTLKYLQMGGRLSKTSAVVGSILNMKPIIAVRDGKISAEGKARGESGAFEKVVEMIKANPIDENYPVVLGHSNSTETLSNFVTYLEKSGIVLKNVKYAEIGLVIGVHVGPGAVGICYKKI